MRRVVTGLLLATALMATIHQPAWAQDDGNPLGGGDGGGLDSGVGGSGPDYFVDVGRVGAGGVGVGESDIECTYEVYDYAAYQLFWARFPGGGSGPVVEEGDPGSESLFANDWVVMLCASDSGGLTNFDGFQIGDPPDAGIMLEHARRNLHIPLPAARFSPDATAPQIVGLQTWLWVDPTSAIDQTATACIPDVPPFYACARIDATFVDVAFSMGDGTPELNCQGPGVAYDTSRTYESQAGIDHCYHLYLNADPGSSTYDVVATTIWHLRWDCLYDDAADGSLNPTCGSGDLGLIGRTQTPVPLTVHDLQARATNGG